MEGSADEDVHPLILHYRSLRRDVNTLLAAGHNHALCYPLCHVRSEVEFVRQRENQRMATEATLIQSAIVSVLAGGKDFENLLKRLTDDNEF